MDSSISLLIYVMSLLIYGMEFFLREGLLILFHAHIIPRHHLMAHKLMGCMKHGKNIKRLY